MSSESWKLLPFETAVHSRGSGNSGLPQKEWLAEGQFPVIGQGAEDIEGWTDRKDLLLTPAPAVVLYGGHTRRAKHVSQPFVPGPNVKILQPISAVDSKFLYYFLTQLPIESKGYADHFPLVRKCDIPVPPLAEQQRIVDLLDEAFEGLATAKANAEKNLQNARALFESHLQSVFTQRGPGWVEKTLDKISTNLDSKRVPITKNVRSSGEYPYYGASGIVDYVADYIFEGDNLLVSEDGANLLARSTPIAFSVSGKYWVNNHAHILHFDNMATQRFAEFYLESIKLDEYITGAAQPKLNQKALNSIPIPIPKSVDEQAKIVESVESLQEETQHLTRLYERKRAALEALKKSLLHQAFTGEL
jgi:type I restriction enzyme S subunit